MSFGLFVQAQAYAQSLTPGAPLQGGEDQSITPGVPVPAKPSTTTKKLRHHRHHYHSTGCGGAAQTSPGLAANCEPFLLMDQDHDLPYPETEDLSKIVMPWEDAKQMMCGPLAPNETQFDMHWASLDGTRAALARKGRCDHRYIQIVRLEQNLKDCRAQASTRGSQTLASASQVDISCKNDEFHICEVRGLAQSGNLQSITAPEIDLGMTLNAYTEIAHGRPISTTDKISDFCGMNLHREGIDLPAAAPVPSTSLIH